MIFVVFGVGLEVVDVDGRQAGDEQLQLLFVENRDEPLGNNVVKAVEKRVDLLPNGTWQRRGVWK